jgi:hypothetical protein
MYRWTIENSMTIRYRHSEEGGECPESLPWIPQISDGPAGTVTRID